MNAQEILIGARDLIAQRGRWGKGHYAVDKGGLSISTWDENAFKFCAVGAVSRMMMDATLEERRLAMDTLASVVEGGDITNMNDKAKSKKVVIAAFNRAIESLKG